MKTKKIVFVLPTLDAGGAENYALRFVSHNKGVFDFHVLSIKTKKGDLHEHFENAGSNIRYQSIGYFNPIKLIKLYDFFKKNDFDTISCFNGNFAGLPLLIAKLAGVKNRIVFYRRSTNAFGKSRIKLLYNNIAKYLVRKNATLILSNSYFAFQNFHSNYYKTDSRFRVIPNGINAADFDATLDKSEAKIRLNILPTQFVIGHVGRYDPAKNHDTIFKVAQIIVKQFPDVLFVFCGKNTDSDAFFNEIKKHNLEKNIKVLGLQSDLSSIYKAFDVFYFPSITEGQPNALIEAMISGLPIITSDIPPIREATPSDFHEFLINPMDVSQTVTLLSKFIKEEENASIYIHKKWAIAAFDVETNFNLFKEVL